MAKFREAENWAFESLIEDGLKRMGVRVRGDSFGSNKLPFFDSLRVRDNVTGIKRHLRICLHIYCVYYLVEPNQCQEIEFRFKFNPIDFNGESLGDRIAQEIARRCPNTIMESL